MKQVFSALSAALLLFVFTGASLAQQLPAKESEGPEVKRQETRGSEGLDIRRKAKKKVTNADAQKSKVTEGSSVRRKAKKKTGAVEGKQPPKGTEASDVKK
jgi:hypothetical protein